MSERRRKFWGWGYEDDTVPAEELAWFEQAWSKLLAHAAADTTSILMTSAPNSPSVLAANGPAIRFPISMTRRPERS